ncbi:MAG TPA: TonB-dependent receptor [Chitinophagaceae bacterium]|nr:TonB-dependent receptor [Chitinophagaceae bacterium]
MTKLTLFTLIFLIASKFTIAQGAQEGSIIGIVTDDGDQKIIDAATVSLFKAKDSALVKINLTDKKGNFFFEHLGFGSYYVLATSTGHLKAFSSLLVVNNATPVSAGTLQLKNNVKTLSAVNVTAVIKKPFIERKIDRTVINVDASITNAGTTALEVLEKAPGVTVDKDGNVSLKGKQGVMIMMDGKPSYLSGQELANLLKNMPSSSIDQIEIMTNPSAKYDAAGNSGVINIKTKKNKIKGINGSVSAGVIQSRYTKTNNSLNLNYRTGKVNIFGNYGYSYWQGSENLSIIRNFRNLSTKELETIFDQQSFMRHHSTYQDLKAGIDFYATKKTTIGVVFSGYVNPSGNLGDNTTLLKDADKQIDSIVLASNKDKKRSTNFATNFNLRHEFDTTGKEFTVDLDYLTYYQNSNQLFDNNFLNPDYTVRRAPTQLRGSLPATVNIYSAKTDFVFPLKKSAKLEAGLKSSYVTTDNDALYENKTATGYATDEGKTNHFIYKENIYAGYLNYNRQIKKWGMQLGLRAENTNAKGHQEGNTNRPDSSFTKNYINLFPTAYVSYEMNKKNTFSVNYGRRIDRPAYQDLNPFYYFLDEYTYEVGNTLLQPQFTDNIELSHTYNGFLTTTINYSKTNDVFADVLKQINSERKTFLTKENIASKTNYGLAVSANFPVTKFLSTNIYTNVIHDAYKGELNGGFLNVNNTMFFSNVNNQFKFKKGWSAELSGFYRSQGIEGQIVMNPMWRMDAGVQKQVLKSKGTIKFSVRDIFKSQNFSGYVKYQDIDVYIKNTHDSRSASLTFSYRFGKPIKNQQSRRTGGASDEQNRVKTGGN